MSDQEPALQDYERYVAALFAAEDDALTMARETAQNEGLPSINVSASEGKLLYVLARIVRARRILEIGTLGAYSTTWLARALPADGRMITLELDQHHADVSRSNLASAGLSARVDVRVGPAAVSLDEIAHEGAEPFDLVFIDADKDNYPVYLEKCLPLTRSGGLILGDNTLNRRVIDPKSDAPVAAFNRQAATHPDLDAIIVPVLRESIDGLMITVKR